MQGGTADSVVLFIYVHDSSLTDLFFSVRGVFFSEQKSTVEQVDLHARMQGHMRTLDSTT